MKISRSTLATIAGALAVACIAAYLWWQRNALLEINLVRPWLLVLCVLGMFGNVFWAGIVNHLMYRQLGVKISIAESTAITMVSIAANFIVPLRGGAAIRAVYLKRRYDFSYASFMSSFVALYILAGLVSGFSSLLAGTWLILADEVEGLQTLMMVSALIAIAALVTLRLPQIEGVPTVLGRYITEISQGWHRLKESGASALSFLGVTMLQNACAMLSLWAAAGAIGIDLGMAAAILVGALGVLSTMVSITPGSIGLYEATVGTAIAAIGMGGVNGVVVALIARVALAAILLVTSPLAARYLARHADAG